MSELCKCSGLEEAIRQGVQSMKDEGAPKILINDYINDMWHCEWINCTCQKALEGK